MTSELDIELARAEHGLVLSDQNLTMESLMSETLTDAHTTLMGLATTLESMVVDKKAMSPVMVFGCQAAITAVSGGGLPASMVSLEAYTGTPEQQTALSLESVSDTLKKIWEKIKLSIKRAIQAISDFISKLFGGLEKLEKKVDELKTKSSDLAKRQIKTNDKMTITNASRLMLNNTASPKVVEMGMRTIYEELYQATTTLTGVMGIYQKQVMSILGKFELLDGGIITAFEENEVDLTGQTLKIFKSFTSRTELPGGRALKIKMTDQSSPDSNDSGSVKIFRGVSIVDHPNAKNPSNKIEADIPSAEWVTSRLNEAAAFTQAYSKDKRQARIDEYTQKKNALIDKIDQSMGRPQGSGQRGGSITTILNKLQDDYAATIVRLDSYAFRYVRAVVAYLEDCLAALEAADTKATKTA